MQTVTGTRGSVLHVPAMPDVGGVRQRTVRLGSVDVTLLEAGGQGPLALCLHGFPDTAFTWRHLVPRLADRGFHAVAPFLRGYWPTSLASDQRYDLDALAQDVTELRTVLRGGQDSVLVGHDWGAEIAYAVIARAPSAFRNVVAMAVPPPELDSILLRDHEQLRRFWYQFFFAAMPATARDVVAADDFAFVERLWRQWSPGYAANEDLVRVRESLRFPGHLDAALSYYADNPLPAAQPDTTPLPRRQGPPVLYLHGSEDGCIAADLVTTAPEALPPGSRLQVIDGAGHFLPLERPDIVNDLVADWLLRRT